MRRSSLMVVALALLSACSGTDCGPKTELQPGDPCGDRLFTYCPAAMACCLSGSSQVPICAMELKCRWPLLGEPCDNQWSNVGRCKPDLTCQDGRCICAPGCPSTDLCWRDKSSCVYECCRYQHRCVNGSCVAPPPDLGPNVRRDQTSDRPPDAAVEGKREAGGVWGAALGSDLPARGDDGPP